MKDAQAYREATHKYYTEVENFVNRQSTQTIIDIGCGPSTLLTRLKPPRKTAFDLWHMPTLPGVENIQGDLLTYPFPRKYGIVMCLQVLEHIQDVEPAIVRLFQITDSILIVSLPYLWEQGKEPGHIHDPIDDAKIAKWFKGRKLIRRTICDHPARVILCFVRH